MPTQFILANEKEKKRLSFSCTGNHRFSRKSKKMCWKTRETLMNFVNGPDLQNYYAVK